MAKQLRILSKLNLALVDLHDGISVAVNSKEGS